MSGNVTDKIAAIIGMIFLIGIVAVILVAVVRIFIGF